MTAIYYAVMAFVGFMFVSKIEIKKRNQKENSKIDAEECIENIPKICSLRPVLTIFQIFQLEIESMDMEILKLVQNAEVSAYGEVHLYVTLDKKNRILRVAI